MYISEIRIIIRLTIVSLLITICHCNNLTFESRIVEYNDGNTTLKGYLAYNPSINSLRPVVVVVHDWNGRDEFENGKADALVRLGYVGFALDLFGTVGRDPTENQRLTKPFRDDKNLLLRRLQLALDEINKLVFVDKTKVAAIGFCFGGSSVLEMARNNLKTVGVVSFHGGVKPAEPKQNDTITSKVLVLMGYEDQAAPPKDVVDFQAEMTQRNADWQIHIYGNHTYHAFTEPKANSPPRSQYHPISDRRSWIVMKNFLEEIFTLF